MYLVKYLLPYTFMFIIEHYKHVSHKTKGQQLLFLIILDISYEIFDLIKSHQTSFIHKRIQWKHAAITISECDFICKL